jgi:hypothetical protein
MGEMRSTFEIMGVEHERKRPLETYRLVKYEDNNLTMDCKEVKWEDVGWVHLTRQWICGGGLL